MACWRGILETGEGQKAKGEKSLPLCNYSANPKTRKSLRACPPLLMDDCKDAGGRATQEQLPRGLGRGELNKHLALFDSPHPTLSRWRGIVVLRAE